MLVPLDSWLASSLDHRFNGFLIPAVCIPLSCFLAMLVSSFLESILEFPWGSLYVFLKLFLEGVLSSVVPGYGHVHVGVGGAEESARISANSERASSSAPEHLHEFGTA